MDAYARAKDPRVRQVTASLAGSWQTVEILRADGTLVRDVRPLVRLNVQVVVGEGDRQESGSYGTGGRQGFGAFIAEDSWAHSVDEALRQALVNLGAEPAPAGTFDVVLGPGWPGILLHEAIGHGLEGDFNRKKQSAFSGLMGEKVAADGVTVMDDGTIDLRRGSLTVDDEGTPSRSDDADRERRPRRLHAGPPQCAADGREPTGNGRRQSYAHLPMPRMTNTYMLGGDKEPQRDHRLGQGRHLRRLLRRRSGRHHLGQICLPVHRGLPHQGRQDRQRHPRGHADRQRPDRPQAGLDDRQRHVARPGIGMCGKNGQLCRSASASRRCASTSSSSAARRPKPLDAIA